MLSVPDQTFLLHKDQIEHLTQTFCILTLTLWDQTLRPHYELTGEAAVATMMVSGLNCMLRAEPETADSLDFVTCLLNCQAIEPALPSLELHSV